MSAAAPEPYRMTGPSALAGDPRRALTLAVALALSEFKLRFFGSALGYLWSLARPLLMFGILYAVFTTVFRLGSGIEFYPVTLLTAIVIYEFFSEATSTAVTAVVMRENLVRKVHFPRMAIPLSVTLTAAFNLALNFVAVLIFFGISGVEVRLSWLELPLLLIGVVALATGVSMLLSPLYVPFRDLSPIWDVLLRAIFYGTPVIFPIELVMQRSETLAHIAMLNPLAMLIQQIRHAVIDPAAPSAAEAVGGGWLLIVPIGLLVALCVGGFVVFNRMAPRIAEEL